MFKLASALNFIRRLVSPVSQEWTPRDKHRNVKLIDGTMGHGLLMRRMLPDGSLVYRRPTVDEINELSVEQLTW